MEHYDLIVIGSGPAGEKVPELIHVASQVMMSGGSINEFVNAVYNYPTLTEVYKSAAYDGLDLLEQWNAAYP